MRTTERLGEIGRSTEKRTEGMLTRVGEEGRWRKEGEGQWEKVEEEEANEADVVEEWNLLEAGIGRWRVLVMGRTGPLDLVLEEDAIEVEKKGERRVKFSRGIWLPILANHVSFKPGIYRGIPIGNRLEERFSLGWQF